tara:strand:- start:440 stop:1075 length:636 start_codon:yes stop_codon:yes gene_type:complete
MSESKALTEYLEKRSRPRCSYLVIDNFLSNPHETRKYILTQDFPVSGNYPGRRTKSFATEGIKDLIQQFVQPFAGKITYFPIGEKDGENYNGAFQYTTSRDRSWIHTDSWNNWAGVLYLTPDAPHSGGTGIFRHKETGVTTEQEAKLRGLDEKLGTQSQDYTAWEQIDTVGNVFNRLILFDATQYHASLDYFGTNMENSRLFQTFFFSTER